MRKPLRRRKSEDSATRHPYMTLHDKPLAVEAAHFPGAPAPYLCVRLQGSKKVLHRQIMSAGQFESFLLNISKEDKPQ